MLKQKKLTHINTGLHSTSKHTNLYNGKFNQCLEVTITAKDHDACLQTAAVIKKQCDAWSFCVRYDEHKSARKGTVLQRSILIYQNAYAGDIVIFKEAIRRIC